jgi:hypothetical protein
MLLKKDGEEWMTMIYGMESLSVLGWTNVQKLSLYVFENMNIYSYFMPDCISFSLQPFWVKICWYWTKDLQEQSFKSAAKSDFRLFDMGTNELLQSDLTQWSEASILAGQNLLIFFFIH